MIYKEIHRIEEYTYIYIYILGYLIYLWIYRNRSISLAWRQRNCILCIRAIYQSFFSSFFVPNHFLFFFLSFFFPNGTKQCTIGRNTLQFEHNLHPNTLLWIHPYRVFARFFFYLHCTLTNLAVNIEFKRARMSTRKKGSFFSWLVQLILLYLFIRIILQTDSYT